ncbi:unnamed protein product [Calypogeia fissa]
MTLADKTVRVPVFDCCPFVRFEGGRATRAPPCDQQGSSCSLEQWSCRDSYRPDQLIFVADPLAERVGSGENLQHDLPITLKGSREQTERGEKTAALTLQPISISISDWRATSSVMGGSHSTIMDSDDVKIVLRDVLKELVCWIGKKLLKLAFATFRSRSLGPPLGGVEQEQAREQPDEPSIGNIPTCQVVMADYSNVANTEDKTEAATISSDEEATSSDEEATSSDEEATSTMAAVWTAKGGVRSDGASGYGEIGSREAVKVLT